MENKNEVIKTEEEKLYYPATEEVSYDTIKVTPKFLVGCLLAGAGIAALTTFVDRKLEKRRIKKALKKFQDNLEDVETVEVETVEED